MEEEIKSPRVWKVALVLFPTGLALSVVLALWWKIKVEDQRGVASLSYEASDFDPKNLRDSLSKLEDVLGPKGYDGIMEQRALRQAASMIQGELGFNNLGYKLREEEALRQGGRIWKNYWVQIGGGQEREALWIWANYRTDAPSTAALLSLAEWSRGRQFSRPIVIAFTVEPLLQEEAWRKVAVREIGKGSTGLAYEESASSLLPVAVKGEVDPNWKNTSDWDDYEAQVRELCKKVDELVR